MILTGIMFGKPKKNPNIKKQARKNKNKKKPNINHKARKNPNVKKQAGKNPNINHKAGKNPNVNHKAGKNPNINHKARKNPNVNHKAGKNPNINHKARKNPNVNNKAGKNSNVNNKAGKNPNVNHKAGKNPNIKLHNCILVNTFTKKQKDKNYIDFQDHLLKILNNTKRDEYIKLLEEIYDITSVKIKEIPLSLCTGYVIHPQRIFQIIKKEFSKNIKIDPIHIKDIVKLQCFFAKPVSLALQKKLQENAKENIQYTQEIDQKMQILILKKHIRQKMDEKIKEILYKNFFKYFKNKKLIKIALNEINFFHNYQSVFNGFAPDLVIKSSKNLAYDNSKKNSIALFSDSSGCFVVYSEDQINNGNKLKIEFTYQYIMYVIDKLSSAKNLKKILSYCYPKRPLQQMRTLLAHFQNIIYNILHHAIEVY